VGGIGQILNPNDGSVQACALEEPVEPRNTVEPAVSITMADDEIGFGKIDGRLRLSGRCLNYPLSLSGSSLTSSAGSAIKTGI
jgi:hypothetical protein